MERYCKDSAGADCISPLPPKSALSKNPSFVQLAAQNVVFYAVMVPLYDGWPEGVAEKIGMMLLIQLVFLIIMVGVVVGLMRIVPGFLARVQQEWTLLSFLLYGMAIVPVLGNDKFRGVEGYEIVSLLILALGAGLYLTAPRRWQRILALVVPVILSPAVMSLGLYQTFPLQSRHEQPRGRVFALAYSAFCQPSNG